MHQGRSGCRLVGLHKGEGRARNVSLIGAECQHDAARQNRLAGTKRPAEGNHITGTGSLGQQKTQPRGRGRVAKCDLQAGHPA